jgi:hypothetical protein
VEEVNALPAVTSVFRDFHFDDDFGAREMSSAFGSSTVTESEVWFSITSFRFFIAPGKPPSSPSRTVAAIAPQGSQGRVRAEVWPTFRANQDI